MKISLVTFHSGTVICLASWSGQGFQVRGQGQGLQVNLLEKKKREEKILTDLFYKYPVLDVSQLTVIDV